MEQHALHAIRWTDVRHGWTQWLLSRLAQNTLTGFIWYHRFHSYIQHSLISGMTNPMCFVKWKKRWKQFWISVLFALLGQKWLVLENLWWESWKYGKTINIYSQNKLKCDSGFSDSFGDTTLVMRRRALTWRRLLKITIGFEYWRVTIIYGIKRSGLLQEKLLTITEWSSLCISSPLTLWNLLTVWFVFWITSVYAFCRMLFF